MVAEGDPSISSMLSSHIPIAPKSFGAGESKYSELEVILCMTVASLILLLVHYHIKNRHPIYTLILPQYISLRTLHPKVIFSAAALKNCS